MAQCMLTATASAAIDASRPHECSYSVEGRCLVITPAWGHLH